MTISQYFPIYDQLDKADQERLDYAAVKRSVPKGTLSMAETAYAPACW